MSMEIIDLGEFDNLCCYIATECITEKKEVFLKEVHKLSKGNIDYLTKAILEYGTIENLKWLGDEPINMIKQNPKKIKPLFINHNRDSLPMLKYLVSKGYNLVTHVADPNMCFSSFLNDSKWKVKEDCVEYFLSLNNKWPAAIIRRYRIYTRRPFMDAVYLYYATRQNLPSDIRTYVASFVSPLSELVSKDILQVLKRTADALLLKQKDKPNTRHKKRSINEISNTLNNLYS